MTRTQKAMTCFVLSVLCTLFIASNQAHGFPSTHLAKLRTQCTPEVEPVASNDPDSDMTDKWADEPGAGTP